MIVMEEIIVLNFTQEELVELDAKHTVSEIVQQPRLWKELIAMYKQNKERINDFFESVKIKHDQVRVLLTGAGTSAYVGETFEEYLNKQNQSSDFTFESLSTTSIVSNPTDYLYQNTPTILVSYARSGNSPESLATVELAEQLIDDLYQVTITCSKEGKLAQKAKDEEDTLLLLMPDESNDQGFAMTSSFTCMSLMTLLLFDTKSDEQKEAIVRSLIDSAEDVLSQANDIKAIVTEDFSRLVYLGSGSLEGISKEAQLKILELTAGEVISMYESPLGFRHGPKSFVNDETVIILFQSSNTYTNQYSLDLLNEVKGDQIAKAVWSVTLNSESPFEGNEITIRSDKRTEANDSYNGLVYIVFAQMVALFTSIQVNNNPDNPSPTGTVNRVVKGVTIHPYNG